jgi:hypothetical protein
MRLQAIAVDPIAMPARMAMILETYGKVFRQGIVLPTTAYVTCFASIPDRSKAAHATMLPRSSGAKVLNEPPNVPMADRTALNTKTSLLMTNSLYMYIAGYVDRSVKAGYPVSYFLSCKASNSAFQSSPDDG